MNFSFLAPLAGAFTGLARDRQRERELAQQNFENTESLARLGYRPVGAVAQDAAQQSSLADQLRSSFAGSPVNGAGAYFTPMANVGAAQADDRSSALRAALQNTITTPQGQSFAFDYDTSPQGLAERRAAKIRTMQDTAAQQRQDAKDRDALARQTAKEQAAAQKAQADEAERVQHVLSISQQAKNPVSDDMARSIAHDPKVYEAWLTPQFAPKPATEPGTWEVSKLTRNGRPLLMNSKTMEFREAPQGMALPDTGDSPQQLMLGQRGLQGAKMMFHGHQAMQQFEAKAKADPNLYAGWDQFLAEFNKEIDSGKVSGWSAAQKSAAITHLNKTNPDLAQYIRAGMQFAFGENEIQQRPSDFRTKMSEAMNSISAGMNPETIDMVAGIRAESMLPTLETYQKLRQRWKLPADTQIDSYVAKRRGDQGDAGSPPQSDPVGVVVDAVRSGRTTMQDVAGSSRLTAAQKLEVRRRLGQP